MAAVVLIVVLAAGALFFVQRHTPPTAAAPSTTGYLVYAATDDAGKPHLWSWNLSEAAVTEGPAIGATPTELLFSYAIRTGSIAMTTPTPSGAFEASVVRTLDPTDAPAVLATGRLVAWLSSGGFVSVVKTSAAPGCGTHVRIVTSSIDSGIRKEPLDTVRCGTPIEIDRDLTSPYLTIERSGRPTIYRVGDNHLSPVLAGYRALSISLNGDLLVRRADPADPLALYYPSQHSSRPATIGTSDAPLVPERVLAWDGGGDNAYVLGRVAGVRGVYQVRLPRRSGPRPPVLLVATDAQDVSATVTPTGTVYVSADGIVRAVHGSDVTVQSVPRDAPIPTGPLLWISTLPYSPSVGG